MRLTAARNPETIRRYQHLRRAGLGRTKCGVPWPEGGRGCTRESGHRGPHAFHARFGGVQAVWEGGATRQKSSFTALEPRKPRPAGKRSNAGSRPVGLREGSDSWLASAGRRLLAMVLDIEELALFLMFLAFVYFAIDWMKIIFR